MAENGRKEEKHTRVEKNGPPGEGGNREEGNRKGWNYIPGGH